MKIDYCKVVEDLMPLYYDELVSQETREFIKSHLGQCNCCREKYENLSAKVPISKVDIVNASREDKYKSAQEFLLKVKKRMYLLGVLVLIIVLMVSAGSFFYGKRLNHDGPIKVESAEDFASKVVPGWQRAQRSGQVVDLGISKPIPGTSAVITFEKVWYTSSYTYVLYTVKEPDKKYVMASAKEIDIPVDKNMRNNLSMEPLSQRWGGISPAGYHQVMVFLGYNTPVPARQLILTASNWIAPKVSMKPDTANAIEGKVSVQLPLSDEFLTERSEKIKLDQSYDWEGRSLHLTGLEVGSSRTLLYGEVELQPGETLNGIEGTIKCGQQWTGLSYESIVPGDTPNSFKFVFYGEPLSEWPGEVSLDIKALEFKTPDTLTLPVDWSLYADKKEKIKIPLRQEKAASFYDSTIRLWTVEPDKWINLEIVEPSKAFQKNEPYITISTNIWIDPSGNYSSGLKVTNENGHILRIDGTAGGNIEGDSKIGIGFGIAPEDVRWKSSKEIIITINKPTARLIVNYKTTIH